MGPFSQVYSLTAIDIQQFTHHNIFITIHHMLIMISVALILIVTIECAKLLVGICIYSKLATFVMPLPLELKGNATGLVAGIYT